jgi:hypothetical protein
MAAYRQSSSENFDDKGPVLSFALPKTNLSLSTLMAYSKYSSSGIDEEYFKNITINRLGRFEVPEGFICAETGGQAFHRLLDGEVIFALGSPEIFREDWEMKANRDWPGAIHRLCQIAEGKVVGISTKPVGGVRELAKLTIGCPSGSILQSRIRRKIQEQTDLKVGQVRPYETPEEAGVALSEDQINTLVGLRSWVERARNASSSSERRAPKFHRLSVNWFGLMTYDAYVNVQHKHFAPIAVRTYLKRLLEASTDNRVKLHLEELKDILSDYTGRIEVRKAKEDFEEDSLEFKIKEINHELLLSLWEKETSSTKH